MGLLLVLMSACAPSTWGAGTVTAHPTEITTDTIDLVDTDLAHSNTPDTHGVLTPLEPRDVIALSETFGCAAHHERGLWCWGNETAVNEPAHDGLTRVDILADVPVGIKVATMDVGYGGIAYTPEGDRVYWPALFRSWEELPADGVAEVNADGCWITTRGRLVCGPGMLAPVDGYQHVSMSRFHMYCGLRDDGGVDCWNDGVPWTWSACKGMEVANTRFRAIAVYGVYFAGITLDGAVVYAGNACDERANVIPDGDWVDIANDEGRTVCVRSRAGEIVCDRAGRLEPGPPGPFVAMNAHLLTVCGMRPDGPVECWGGGQFGRDVPTPPP